MTATGTDGYPIIKSKGSTKIKQISHEDAKKILSKEYERVPPNHPTRWRKCNVPELLGADYALRLFLTSPVVRGEVRKQCIELINEVRDEINSRPEECHLWNTLGLAIKWEGFIE